MRTPLLIRFVSRVARRHLFWHLLVPIAVGALCEAAIAGALAYLHSIPFSRADFVQFFVSLERLGFIVGVFLTFSVVLYWHLQTEAEVTRVTLGPVLAKTLVGAERFFALATIPIKEWFEPGTQVYFATIVQHQLDNPGFWHDRALMLYTESDRENVRAPLMDESHARAFVKLHKLANARLSFVERAEIFSVLNTLTVSERRLIGCYTTLQGVLPDVILARVRLEFVRRRIRRLSIALVEYKAGVPPRVIVFAKNGPDLGITVVNADAGRGAVYKKVIDAIKEAVLEPAGAQGERPGLKGDHDFMGWFE